MGAAENKGAQDAEVPRLWRLGVRILETADIARSYRDPPVLLADHPRRG